MCCVLDTIKTILKIVAVIVLVLGLACIGVGLWALIGNGGPLEKYLGSEHSWMGIQIIGGLLVAAGVILAIDFALACANSTKLLSGCCLPIFFIFALVTTLVFFVIGVLSFTIMDDALATSLDTSFSYEIQHGVTDNGPLNSAQQDYDCCGGYPCDSSNATDYENLYNCICTGKEGCVKAITDDLQFLTIPMGVGCFAVAAITSFMFVLSICLCCL